MRVLLSIALATSAVVAFSQDVPMNFAVQNHRTLRGSRGGMKYFDQESTADGSAVRRLQHQKSLWARCASCFIGNQPQPRYDRIRAPPRGQVQSSTRGETGRSASPPRGQVQSSTRGETKSLGRSASSSRLVTPAQSTSLGRSSSFSFDRAGLKPTSGDKTPGFGSYTPASKKK
ncbi:unnamed protein product [Aphanomyces euteiches]